MSLEQTCIESLASHIRSKIADCDVPHEGCVTVAGLGMAFCVDGASATPFHKGYSVSVVFDARAQDADEAGILVLTVGFGDTPETAAVDAGHQWATSVLPVLLSYVLHQEQPEVQRCPMVVGVQDSGERFGWTAHLGPVTARVYGPPDAPEIDRGDLSPATAYKPVFNAIHPFAAHNQLMWVESFAARYPEGKLDATCRLQNDDWAEGRAALLAWAASWPDTGPCVLTKRQFIILEPTPVGRLASDKDLVAILEREMAKQKKPWWRRMLGGA